MCKILRRAEFTVVQYLYHNVAFVLVKLSNDKFQLYYQNKHEQQNHLSYQLGLNKSSLT